MKRTTRLLFCDDEGDTRETYRKAVSSQWPLLFNEDVAFDVCEDIIVGRASSPNKSLNEVGTYDALLLDLLWRDRPDGENHGVELFGLVRAKFPELPIIIVSEQATTAHFQKLIPLSISAYLSKQDTTVQTWCAEIKTALERAYVDRSGLPLYRTLRELLADPAAWNAEAVNDAASQVWRHESSHDKWNEFWDSMGTIVAQQKVKAPFDLMKDYFARSDLITLGALPSMRGHLEHVLYVYFTGYVISHKLPIFRSLVTTAAKNLLGAGFDESKSEQYWDLFQLAWLTSATLHDTGYSLELLPDVLRRVSGIQETFSFAAGAPVPSDAGKCTFDWTKAQIAKQAFQTTLNFFDYGDGSWIADNAMFRNKRGEERINHGVASGALFIEKFHAKCQQLVEQQKELVLFFNWAGTAMALHSLKHAGSNQGIALRLTTDPLSFLLLLCDELQIWDRERPDAAKDSSVFRRVELTGLAIEDTRIVASVSHVPYAGVVPTHRMHGESLDKAIIDDNEVLARYLDVGPISVEIKHTVRGSDMVFPTLNLP